MDINVEAECVYYGNSQVRLCNELNKKIHPFQVGYPSLSLIQIIVKRYKKQMRKYAFIESIHGQMNKSWDHEWVVIQNVF